MSFLVESGTILAATSEFAGGFYIEGETIRQIGSNLNMGADRTMGAVGRYILPGGVDEHVHHGSFGGRLFETAEAVTVGGTTAIVGFTPQEKDVPLLDAIRQRAAKAKDISSVDFTFHVVIMDPKGSVFEEVRYLPEMRVVTLKFFMAYKGTASYCDDEAILNAMVNAKGAGATMMVHAENTDIITVLTDHYLNQGKTAPVYHYHARPPVAEEEATGRVITLVKIADRPFFVVHVSAREAMETIRRAHSRGWPVLGKTCTHYLTLTTDYLDQSGSEEAKYICSPPPRPQEHAGTLWQVVWEGWLTTMGSNHCILDGGFEGAKKRGTNFSNIPNGCPGVQGRLALPQTCDVCAGMIIRQEFVELFATDPAKMVGLPGKGELRIGVDADIVILDPGWKGATTSKDNLYGIDHEPFEGFKIQGRPEQAYLRDRLVTENGVFAGKRGKGKWQKYQPHGLCYDYYHK